MNKTRFIQWFSAGDPGQIALLGDKVASLSEFFRVALPQGVSRLDGFVVTTEAYRTILADPDLRAALQSQLDRLHLETQVVSDCGQRVRDMVYAAPWPADLRAEILTAYRHLLEITGEEPGVAVRSSVYAASERAGGFIGQHESYLNIRGEELLLDACRRCLASAFTDRAISYRTARGVGHFEESLAIGIMPMVRADLGASGLIYSADPETGHPQAALVTACYGLGESLALGLVEPDEFYVHKPGFAKGHHQILRKSLGAKQVKTVFSYGRSRETIREIPTPNADRDRFCISDEDVLLLADSVLRLEQHYQPRLGRARSLVVEWAKDGLRGGLYLLQVRTEPASAPGMEGTLETYVLQPGSRILATGRPAGTRIASGPARLIADAHQLCEFQPGEVLVADMTMPDWGPVMKTAAAIVTNRGGRTCHAAIVARELGIPAVIGAETATETIPQGALVTVSCADADLGRVYEGRVPFEIQRRDLGALKRPATRILMSLGNPDRAFALSRLPNDGVGLARMEFVISEHIGVHPMALLHPEQIKDPEILRRIGQLARLDVSPTEFFVRRLTEGIGMIAAAFHSKPVLLRLSDLKSNEYASLLGGEYFEPREDNPMLGFRGAARYTHPDYAEAFALECEAIRRVREDLGLSNLHIMVPFCRSVGEGERVLASLAAHGLRSTEGGLEIHLMCELPNNVLQIDAFARLFYGVSIGLNDLTQLILGVDRDSELVAYEFNERDSGVLEMIRRALEGARARGRKVTACGQAVSDNPELLRFLIELGIDSVTLNPDAVLQGLIRVLEIEQTLGKPPRSGWPMADEDGTQQIIERDI